MPCTLLVSVYVVCKLLVLMDHNVHVCANPKAIWCVAAVAGLAEAMVALVTNGAFEHPFVA